VPEAFLDQHDIGAKPLVLLAHRTLQLGIFHAPAQDIEQIEVLALDPPARAHAEIAELGRVVGGVPALHDAGEFVGPFVRRVAVEPCGLDHAAALRRGHLLVLAGEIILLDRAANVFEGGRRLAFGMQWLAVLPGEYVRPQLGIERVGLVVLGDRRKRTTSQSF
jgi:hypothetical protein